MARGHLRTPQESQESGNMAGSIGRLPFLTRTSGRQSCCQSVPPRLELTFGHTQVSTQALPWLSLRQLRSMSFPRTYSGRVLLLERLQLPLPVDEAVCSGCHAPLDPLGRHRAACARTGRLKKRRLQSNAFLRDMNVGVRASDERRIEVLAQDLPCFGGVQLAIDITLRGVLSSSKEPHSNAADVDGAVLARARADKEATYPELLTGRCRLVVMAIETGGRWSSEAMDFVRQLAFAKAREVPSHMRFPIALVWERRWTRMLSTACSLAFASSLVEPSDGEPPSLAELLGQDPR